MRLLAPLALSLLCLAGAFALGGLAPLGRIALALDMPRLAVPMFRDPRWRGIAHYRAQDWDAAAADFREARAFHDLGNAETMRGNYAAALEAFDVARARGDADAAVNFDLVASYYAGLALDPETPVNWFAGEEDADGPVSEAPVGKGSARAAGSGDTATNAGALLGLPELVTFGQARVRQVFDDTFMVANDRWLAQLADVPGDYLAARIAAERKLRAELGLPAL